MQYTEFTQCYPFLNTLLVEWAAHRIDNGLALCKNHHWAFIRVGLVDDYTLLISDNLREESPNARPMREFAGDRIILPVQPQYYPRLEALQWHRENVFGEA
jgi:putative restriction endonuclease